MLTIRLAFLYLVSLNLYQILEAENMKWWQSGVIYQIYPRSYKDNNNDGIGDLIGITESLPYLRDTGVTAVWLSPIYPSPMKDFGYDISNFTDIDPVYGTMADFDKLLKVAKSLGLRLIMDIVPNHSSDLHPWFGKSVAREPGYEDYYVWRDPKGFNNDGSPIPPNNWLSNFYGSAWEYNEERKQFYLHQFAKEQPDLNYRNPAVAQEMKDVFSFWMARGVDGFRVDAIWTLFEHPDLLDEPVSNTGPSDENDPDHLAHLYTRDQPETYDMVRQWRELIDAQSLQDGIERCMMVEMYGTIPLTMAYYGTPDEPIAHFPFNFQFIPANNATSARELKRRIDEWVDNVPSWGWNNWLTGNHDNHRIGSRVGDDMIDAMNILIMTLPGTAITYYGEEIGMVDNLAITYDDGVDPNGCNYPEDQWYIKSRDFERTPFQWNASTNAGFNNGETTWLPIHENYKYVNLEAQMGETNSHYNIYKDLINDVRKRQVWKTGALTTQTTRKDTLAVFRHMNSTEYLVSLMNFGYDQETINLSTLFPIDERSDLTVVVASKNSNLNKGDLVTTGNVDLPGRSAVLLTHQ